MKRGPYVPGVGPLHDVKLMVVAEAPGEIEEQYGRPLIGPTGELTDDLFREAGIRRDEVYITNVSKYRPPLNDFKLLKEIGVSLPEQVENLWKEIRAIRPNCILALGEQALKACAGKDKISNYRGSILPSKDGNIPKVVATFHPANLLYQKKRKGSTGLFKYAWKYVMIADMRRALQQSMFPELRIPNRNLKIARNSLDLYRFLRSYDHLDIATCDIESINCLPVCVGFAFNKYVWWGCISR